MKKLSQSNLLGIKGLCIFVIGNQYTYAADYIDRSTDIVGIWYDIIIHTLVTRNAELMLQVQERFAPLAQWYEINNITVGIIPKLMFVPIIDFMLISIGIFLLGWMLLKWLS